MTAGIDGDDRFLDAAQIKTEGIAEALRWYFDRTCTGLLAIATESARERKREIRRDGCGRRHARPF